LIDKLAGTAFKKAMSDPLPTLPGKPITPPHKLPELKGKPISAPKLPELQGKPAVPPQLPTSEVLRPTPPLPPLPGKPAEEPGIIMSAIIEAKATANEAWTWVFGKPPEQHRIMSDMEMNPAFMPLGVPAGGMAVPQFGGAVVTETPSPMMFEFVF